jgi:hypothetical protein
MSLLCAPVQSASQHRCAAGISRSSPPKAVPVCCKSAGYRKILPSSQQTDPVIFVNCFARQIEPMSFVLHPPASLGPCSSSKAPKLSLPSWLPAPAPPALSVRQRRRALASGAAAIAGARHGGAVQASSVLATPIQAAAPAPYAGSYYDEYMGEDDFGWRQNFNDSFLCGKLLGQVGFTEPVAPQWMQMGQELSVGVQGQGVPRFPRECAIFLGNAPSPQGSFGQVYLAVDLQTVGRG